MEEGTRASVLGSCIPFERGLEATLLSEILILQPVLDYNILHSLKQ